MNLIRKIKESDYGKNYYLFLIIGFCISLRILTPQIIGVGGDDAVESWGMARRLFFNADYFFIHRTARFGTIIPIYLTQLLFGTNPVVYYAAPAIASVIQAVFFYKIASYLKGASFAFISSVLFLSFPQVIRDVSHPRVSVFSTMFFLAALYFALKFYMNSSEQGSGDAPRIRDLFISGINIFFMYMSKEDSIYFLPVIMLIVFLSRKKFSDLVLFGIVPFSLFMTETLIYHFFTEFSLGRLSLLTSNHFDFVPPLASWTSLFDRFTGNNLRPYFRYPLFISLAGGIYILVKKRNGEKTAINPAVFIVLCLFIYLFCLTFLIKGINPLTPLNTFRTRYLNIIIPLMILVITYLVYEISASIKKSGLSDKIAGGIPSIISGNMKAVSLVFLIAYTLITADIFFKVYKKENYRGRSENYFQLHPFKLVNNYYSIITAQYNSGKPFIAGGIEFKWNRFSDVLDTIDSWVKKGMTLEDACRKYKITTEQYYTYLTKAEPVIYFESENIPWRIFLHPDISVSGMSYFDIEKDGRYYRFYYNSYLTGKEKILKDWKNGSTVYPEIIYPPFEVVFTDLKEYRDVRIIPVPIGNLELLRSRKTERLQKK